MDMRLEQWKKAYDYCTKNEHDFMYYNTAGNYIIVFFRKLILNLAPPGLRVMKNFEEFITIKTSE